MKLRSPKYLSVAEKKKRVVVVPQFVHTWLVIIWVVFSVQAAYHIQVHPESYVMVSTLMVVGSLMGLVGELNGD